MRFSVESLDCISVCCALSYSVISACCLYVALWTFYLLDTDSTYENEFYTNSAHSQEREHVILVDCAMQGHHKWQISSGAIHKQNY